MSEIKLLDLNNDWKQVRPTLTFKKIPKHCVVTGYESYQIYETQIAPTSDNVKLKFNLIKNTVKDDVAGKSVVDIGCSNMFFGFLSYFYKAAKVAGIDLDLDYLSQNNQIINYFNMKNVSCENMNAVDYKELTDTIFAFAIIHWIYSCSGFLGSLENVVIYLRYITNECLYVEWIDPADDCISQMLHHLDFNKDFVVQDYTKDNFIKYLQNNFSSVSSLGFTKQTKTREIYRCLV